MRRPGSGRRHGELSDGDGDHRRWADLLAEVAGTGSESTPLLWAELWLHAARSSDLVDLFAAHARAVDDVIVSSLRSRSEGRGTSRSGSTGDMSDEALATVVPSLFRGLSQRRRIDPDAVPDPLLGQALQLLVAGHHTLRGSDHPTGRGAGGPGGS